MTENGGAPRSAGRQLAGRTAWLFLGPLQRHSLALQERWYVVARLLFILRCRLIAVFAHATLDLDIARDARISPRAAVEVWRGTDNRLVVGFGARIWPGALISLRGGSVRIGAGTLVRRQVTLQVSGDLQIGDGVLVSTGVTVHCEEAVSVGDLTLLSEYSTIADSRHLRTPPGVAVHHATRTAPVHIGSNVWMASHVIVTSGVTVGDQAVIGGGAVVTKDVAAGWLVGGNPAQPIRELAVEDPGRRTEPRP